MAEKKVLTQKDLEKIEQALKIAREKKVNAIVDAKPGKVKLVLERLEDVVAGGSGDDKV